MVKGFSKSKGVDFDEIFFLVVKISYVGIVIGLATSLDLDIDQMDVKIAFPRVDYEENIYMEQPKCFILKGKKEMCTSDNEAWLE